MSISRIPAYQYFNSSLNKAKAIAVLFLLLIDALLIGFSNASYTDFASEILLIMIAIRVFISNGGKGDEPLWRIGPGTGLQWTWCHCWVVS